LLSNNILAA